MHDDMENLKENWNQLGITDPLWAISSLHGKKGNKWEVNEFFQRGLQDITEIMKHIEKDEIIIERRRALDFGCGVGRCTQAFARYFDHVEGLDIAPSMINWGNEYNQYGNQVKYHTTEERPLTSFNDNEFDLIWCTDVLQHIDPEYSFGYLKEFLRILSPNGVLIVQIPSQFKSGINNFLFKLKIKNFVARHYGTITKKPVMEYYVINKDTIMNFFGMNGLKIVKILEDSRTGVESYRYFVIKNKLYRR